MFWIQIPCQISTIHFRQREAIAHKLEPITASVLDAVVLVTRVLKHQPPVNKRSWILRRDLAIRSALVVP